jgi:hypothetical protein
MLSRVRGLRWLIDGFLIWWLDLLAAYTHHSELQAISALSLIYTLYSSHTHTHTHIHITVLSLHYSYPVSHTKFSLHSLSPFLPLFCTTFDYRLSQFYSLLQLPGPELDSILILAACDPRYIASGRTHRKHRFLYCCVLISCCTNVFTTRLRSNERSADPRERRVYHLYYCCVTSPHAYVAGAYVADSPLSNRSVCHNLGDVCVSFNVFYYFYFIQI